MEKRILRIIFLAFIFLLISPTALAQVPPDKSLIKSSDSPKVYWFQNNIYYWIIDEPTFTKMAPLWSFANVIEYPAATFSSQILNNPSYKQGPNFVSDNLLIKKTSPSVESTVFLTHNNQKRAFFNYDALIDTSYNFNEANILSVTATLRDSIPSGDLVYAVGYDSGRINLFRDAFNRASGTNNLGYARTTTQPWGTGQIQYFKRLNDNSAIVYNPNENYVYPTYGAIYTKYTARGANIFGFPIGDEAFGIDSSVTGARATFQRFRGGSNIDTSINHHQTGPNRGLTTETHTPILEKWAAIDYGASCAGLPTSDVYSWQNGLRADFENGYIYWDGQRTIASCEPTQDECTQGATRCLTPSAKQTCGNYDEDVWLEWGNDLTCAFGCNAGTGQCNQGSSCSNEIKDGDETDKDCGGSCSACPNDKACLINNDCQSTYCNPNNICSTPSCTDGWRNGNELGIDCGGPCQACPTVECENPTGGDEFIANTYTDVSQTYPSIAIDSQGNFVITWQSYLQDGSFDGIFAQRFDPQGNKIGPEFQVNTYTDDAQRYPSVAMDNQGNFVITWLNNWQPATDSLFDIYAQRFDKNGNRQGGEFRANTYLNGWQGMPVVAMDSQGNFVIAWESDQDGSVYGIYAQRFDPQGNKQGGEFQVNTYTNSWQRYPSIAMDPQGNFVIAWESADQDGSSYGVYAQRFDPQGNKQGGEFRVNSYTNSNQANPSIAMDASGNFVITWESLNQDGSDAGVFAQRFDSQGNKIGPEFQVNTYTNNHQYHPTVSMDSQGNFIIAWRSNWQDGSEFDIHAQRFDPQGNKQGGEFRVNSYILKDEDEPDIIMFSPANFVVTWYSWRTTQYDIAGKLFRCLPLCSNNIKDPTETDLDCGGSCSACPNDKICLINNDCISNYCNPNKICSTPSCTDGWQNQGETDKDCGGNCGDCQNGKSCLINRDCQSNYCDSNKICSVPTCNDGIQNGNEEGKDCGWTCSRSCNKCEEVINNGNPNDKIDVVFVGSGFNRYEDFTNAVNDAIDYDSNGYGIMYYEPFKSYKDRFNFWRVNELNTFGPNRYEYEVSSLGLAMRSCPHMNQLILLSVEPRFHSHAVMDFKGGGGKMAYVTIGCEYLGTCDWPLDVIVDNGETWYFGSSKEEVIRIVVHEFGHSFGGLDDEYIRYNYETPLTPATPNCDQSTCNKWSDVPDAGCNKSCNFLNWYRAYQNTLMKDSYASDATFKAVNERELLKDIQTESKGGGGGVINQNEGYSLSYVLHLKYEKEIVSFLDISLVSGESSFLEDGKDYTLKVLTAENEVLFLDTFGFSLTASFAPPKDWFDEEGEQIFIPIEDTIRTSDIAEVFLSAPYYSNAVAIEILDKDNQLRLRIDVSQYQDLDNDGIGVLDNCPFVSNPEQADTDKNNIGDACNEFEDKDNDEFADILDNCPEKANPTQEDSDKDNVGDVCDPQTCSNNILETGEECDTSALGDKVCKDFGFDAGKLLCSQTCTFDIAQCYDNKFLRGDSNTDGVIDISDPIKTLLYLYSDSQISCKETADTNDDGKIDISDVIYGLNFLFKAGPAIPLPYPSLGIDTTPETPDLGCESYNPPAQAGGGGGLTPEDILNDPNTDQQIKDIIKPYACLLNGDVDQNKKVDMNDYYSLSYALSGKFKINELCKCNADVNEDKLINQNDASILYNSIRYNKPLVKEGECEKVSLSSSSPTPTPYPTPTSSPSLSPY